VTHSILDEVRRGLPTLERLEYTRRAYNLLPPLQEPRILDIGCGPGIPTLELARISGGKVTGMDIDGKALRELEQRADELGLSSSIRTLRCSMSGMKFPDGYFDLVWSEGAAWHIGLRKALESWRRLVPPCGFMAIHDGCWIGDDPPAAIREYCEKSFPGISTHEENLEMMEGQGYKVIGEFKLPEDAWRRIYFGPLKERIPSLRKKYGGDEIALAALDREENETDLCLECQHWYGSAFYILRRD